MQKTPIHTILKESFSKSNKEEWLRIAFQELGEKNSIENLIWKSGNLNFFPYYDQGDLKNTESLKRYHSPPYRIPQLGAGGWQNLPKITVLDEKKANTIALQSLAIGADGVLFDITGHRDVSIDLLLEKINWRYCNISFVTTADDKNIQTRLLSYIAQHHYAQSALRGAIFWQDFAESSEMSMQELPTLENFQPCGFIVHPASPIAEISKSLLYGVMCMEHLIKLGAKKELAFRSISISVPSDENFFTTIAKCKALRVLWYQLSQAYKIENYQPHQLQVHGRSEKWADEKFQPNANMLKNIYDAIAFVLGGADGLTICPGEEDNSVMHRVALHVSNILKEESHLDKVADAVAGAYAIENMVKEFSKAAWGDFQNNVSKL
jgi:methylmalonyl-CoA mutase